VLSGRYAPGSSATTTLACNTSLALGAAICQSVQGNLSFVHLLCRLFTHLVLLVAYTSAVYPAVGVYDGSGTNTYLQGPIGVTIDSNGNIYISDMHSISAYGIIKVMNTLGELQLVFDPLGSGCVVEHVDLFIRSCDHSSGEL
jgi:hypothetical protein